LPFSNAVSESAVLRHPRLEIRANGMPLAGALAAEVVSNNHYAADRFHATLALDADAGSAAFWAGAGDVLLDIGFTLDGATASVIQGAVDRVAVDPIRRMVHLDGRDLTARLIEARTQESFVNQTASEIAATLAGRHGLSADITVTSTPAGRYYQDEHDRISLGQFSRAITEWDLLTWLARQEGFDTFVRGTTLHFGPAPDQPRAWTITPADVTDLRLERALTLARDIEVTVKSWNSRQNSAFTRSARAAGPARGNASPQRQLLVRPNLTPEQALQLAQATLADLTRHRMVACFTMPGELSLMPRDAVLLTATASAFDQTYYVDEVARRISTAHGFSQFVRARNDARPAQATPPADTQFVPAPN